MQKKNPTKQEQEVDLGLMQDNLPVTSRRQGQASPLFPRICIIDFMKQRQIPK